jgi:ATP-dependent protease HslVU (ClpYQ) peptidase subunit
VTTIAAANLYGRYAIAADSRLTISHSTIVSDTFDKIRRISSVNGGPAYFTSAGDARLLNLADKCGFQDAPSVELFVKQIQSWFTTEQWAPAEGIGAPGWGFCGVYMDHSGVWSIDGTFHFRRLAHGEVCAFGSGADFALGAMDWERQISPSTDAGQLAEIGVRAGIRRDSGSGGEVRVIVMDEKGVVVHDWEKARYAGSEAAA